MTDPGRIRMVFPSTPGRLLALLGAGSLLFLMSCESGETPFIPRSQATQSRQDPDTPRQARTTTRPEVGEPPLNWAKLAFPASTMVRLEAPEPLFAPISLPGDEEDGHTFSFDRIGVQMTSPIRRV